MSAELRRNDPGAAAPGAARCLVDRDDLHVHPALLTVLRIQHRRVRRVRRGPERQVTVRGTVGRLVDRADESRTGVEDLEALRIVNARERIRRTIRRGRLGARHVKRPCAETGASGRHQC